RREPAGAPAPAPRKPRAPADHGPARHARADVPVGVPANPSPPRPRERVRLARLPLAPPSGPGARTGLHRPGAEAGSDARSALRPRTGAQGARPPRRGAGAFHRLAGGLTEREERLTLWRVRHYKVVARIIGDEVVGTQGTPVELL